MNLDEILFSRKPGESDEAYAIRVDKLEQLFRNVFNTTGGHELLSLFREHRNPMFSRYADGMTFEQMAYIDAECSFVAMCIRRGTNLGVNEPTNNQP